MEAAIEEFRQFLEREAWEAKRVLAHLEAAAETLSTATRQLAHIQRHVGTTLRKRSDTLSRTKNIFEGLHREIQGLKSEVEWYRETMFSENEQVR